MVEKSYIISVIRSVVSGCSSIGALSTGVTSKDDGDLTISWALGGGLVGAATVRIDVYGSAKGRTDYLSAESFVKENGYSDAGGVAGKDGASIATWDNKS